MGIVRSEVIEARRERDGRVAVRERHVGTDGAEYLRQFIERAGYDAGAGLTASAGFLSEALKQSEIGAVTGELAAAGAPNGLPALSWATAREVLRALREHWRDARALEALLVAEAIDAHSDDDLKAVLRLNDTQLANLRSKLKQMKVRLDAVRAERGG
jgi:hypothetical protein